MLTERVAVLLFLRRGSRGVGCGGGVGLRGCVIRAVRHCAIPRAELCERLLDRGAGASIMGGRSVTPSLVPTLDRDGDLAPSPDHCALIMGGRSFTPSLVASGWVRRSSGRWRWRPCAQLPGWASRRAAPGRRLH